MKRTGYFLMIVLLAGVLVSSLGASAYAFSSSMYYDVTITNVTKDVVFTPFLVATHKKGTSLFTLGEKASDQLGRLAEGGDTNALQEYLEDNHDIGDIGNSGGILAAGESVTVRVKASRRYRFISLAAMLLPTNDAFVALNATDAPWSRKEKTVMAIAYDAGTETNDEDCTNIPGPHCDGTPFSPDDEGEGFVHVHSSNLSSVPCCQSSKSISKFLYYGLYGDERWFFQARVLFKAARQQSLRP